MNNDLISRQEAINALWKALYEYEDKTEKQFQESEDLDVGEWIVHRNFVQNMNDIDRQTIISLPPAQPEIIRCKDCKHLSVRSDALGAYQCAIHGDYPSGEYFCADGKKRDENECYN